MEYKPSFIDQLDVDYISHHGIKGMKWGVRRYQNPDGSYTSAEKLKRNIDAKKIQLKLNNADRVYAQNRVRNDEQRKRILKQVSKKEQKRNKTKWDKIVLEENKKWLSSPHTSQKSLNKSYKKYVNSIIRNAEKQGMRVSKQKGKRFVDKQLLDNEIADTIIDLGVPISSIPRLKRIRGTKYKVTA